jgi:hypothetical protein
MVQICLYGGTEPTGVWQNNLLMLLHTHKNGAEQGAYWDSLTGRLVKPDLTQAAVGGARGTLPGRPAMPDRTHGSPVGHA